MPTDELTYYKAHLLRLSKYEHQVMAIFDDYAIRMAVIAGTIVNYNSKKLFAFSSYPQINKQVNKLMSKMVSEIQFVVKSGIAIEWEKSNLKNDALVKSVFRKPPAVYMDHNTKALSAFQRRKEGGLSLSDRVWRYQKQFQREIELGLDVGLTQGKSAAELGRELRQNLRDPNRLYRRVRDKKGKLVPSKAMKAYHPGQGVYRSSAKNALRMTASEISQAYEVADQTRRQQLDFVVGFEVHTSKNHPVPDMCDDLKGKYPKDFVFRKWHTKCRCYSTSILKTEEEMDADDEVILEGGQPSGKSVNTVKDVPKGFKNWVRNNKERIERAKSKPYFIADNPKFFNARKSP